MSLKSDRAIMNFLNRHLWKTHPISAPALQYGIKHEKIARDSYKSLINSESSMVSETGFCTVVIPLRQFGSRHLFRC